MLSLMSALPAATRPAVEVIHRSPHRFTIRQRAGVPQIGGQISASVHDGTGHASTVHRSTTIAPDPGLASKAAASK
jgi:hypothetical protein